MISPSSSVYVKLIPCSVSSRSDPKHCSVRSRRRWWETVQADESQSFWRGMRRTSPVSFLKKNWKNSDHERVTFN